MSRPCLKDANPFGHVGHSSITLSAPLIRAQFCIPRSSSGNYSWSPKNMEYRYSAIEYHGLWLYYCPDIDISDPESQNYISVNDPIFCLQIARTDSSTFGLVLQRNANNGNYKRVGMFSRAETGKIQLRKKKLEKSWMSMLDLMIFLKEPRTRPRL